MRGVFLHNNLLDKYNINQAYIISYLYNYVLYNPTIWSYFDNEGKKYNKILNTKQISKMMRGSQTERNIRNVINQLENDGYIIKFFGKSNIVDKGGKATYMLINVNKLAEDFELNNTLTIEQQDALNQAIQQHQPNKSKQPTPVIYNITNHVDVINEGKIYIAAGNHQSDSDNK